MTGERATVIVCASSSDRFPQLVSAVGSARGRTRPPGEVLVVIDHNPDLRERVTRRFPELTVLENAGPPGLSGARNTGTAAATGGIVVYLDDDAEAEPGWLESLTGHFERPEVLGVSGYADPRWAAGRPRWWPDEFDWVVGCSYRGLPESVGPVRNLMGCTMALRRDVVEAAGGFDTALGRTGSGAAGCEETELCIRASERFPNGVFLHDPGARVRHLVPATRGTLAYFRSRCFAEGVSKRLVTRRTGVGTGLSTEVAYVRRTLPAGIVRNLAQAVRGEPAGLARAAAITVGLGATALGYLTTGVRASRTPAAAPAPSAVAPVLPLVIDLADPPRQLPETPENGAYAPDPTPARAGPHTGRHHGGDRHPGQARPPRRVPRLDRGRYGPAPDGDRGGRPHGHGDRRGATPAGVRGRVLPARSGERLGRESRRGRRGGPAALSVVFSMSATILVATAMVTTGRWSVAGGMAALAVIAVLGFVPFGPSARHRKPSRIGLRSK